MKNRLWLALLLPVLLIAGISISIYLPRYLIHPNQDFLFAINPLSCYNANYHIKNNQLIYETQKPSAYCKKIDEPLLYRYFVKEQKTIPITYAEAQKLSINFSKVSKQGLHVMTSQDIIENKYYLDLFFFMASSNNQLYLTGHGYTNIILVPKTSFYGKTLFVGWVNP